VVSTDPCHSLATAQHKSKPTLPKVLFFSFNIVFKSQQAVLSIKQHEKARTGVLQNCFFLLLFEAVFNTINVSSKPDTSLICHAYELKAAVSQRMCCTSYAAATEDRSNDTTRG
jgi:hypothetical protein